jgi:hypothetical protein
MTNSALPRRHRTNGQKTLRRFAPLGIGVLGREEFSVRYREDAAVPFQNPVPGRL